MVDPTFYYSVHYADVLVAVGWDENGNWLVIVAF